MAASVVSLPFETTHQTNTEQQREAEEGLDWVLPSKMDCLGRPVRRPTFVVVLRNKLSFTAFRKYIASLGQPQF